MDLRSLIRVQSLVLKSSTISFPLVSRFVPRWLFSSLTLHLQLRVGVVQRLAEKTTLYRFCSSEFHELAG